MQFDKAVDINDRLARTLLSAVLALVAIGSFRKGRRLIGVVAGAGAVGLGYTAATRPDESADTTGRQESETAGSDGMHCSVCSEPIVVGQSRRPNADNVIVHEGCL